MVINRKVLPWLIAGVALAAILLIVLVIVTQAAPNSAPHRQGASISPGVVSYQGQVNIGGVPFSGTGYFRFAIVDSGGTFYWSNDSSIITPTEAVTLTVVNGLFNALLGETNPITYGMFSNSDRWLRVWFDDSIHGVQLLEPDTRITTALFALRADESMTAITSTWSTTATVAITATNATTATFATTALWATQCLSATQWAWYSAFSGNAGTCGTALYALQMTRDSVNFSPLNFARVGGNSWWGVNQVTESVAPGQVSYWTTSYPFTQTNVLTGSSALTFNGSTLSTTNLNVSGSFSATVLTATNATTSTYATTALTATNLTQSPYARIYNNANISIPAYTWITITFNSELWDTNDFHSTESNTSRMIAPITGTYLITFNGRFASSSSGERFVYLRMNANGNIANGTGIAYTSTATRVGGYQTGVSATALYFLIAGDYIEAFVMQSSDVTLACTYSANDSPQLTMVLLP
jgi:hypothetical protein